MNNLYLPTPKNNKTATVVLKLKPEIKNAWVKHCDAKGVTMTEVLTRFIERETAYLLNIK